MGGLFDSVGEKLKDPVGAIGRKWDDPFGDLKAKPATPQPKRASKPASTLMSTASPADKIESVADASPAQKLLRN